eukprot:TRINITY_DN24235_c0_g1_i1.p1 TRINITY_DN24235_c0_g1~~TRINITY_DN24235_c0_g1_i1.p1  ORF type:complete len:482 (+),score=67.63 TRINITY_DN24235_c0_g1_i1:116-1561(+)
MGHSAAASTSTVKITRADRTLVSLREEDAMLIDDDAERNAEQASRNAKMREALLARKRRKELEPEQATDTLDDFMSFVASKTANTANDHQPPWFVARPEIENTILRLHEEFLDFVAFMQHSPKEIEARQEWVQTIKTVCKTVWPSCKVRVFGSFYNGLSLPNADVDVAVLNVPCDAVTGMKVLAENMLAAGKISWLELIEFAKVPIVKMRSQKSGLRADVAFSQPDGIDTSKFIRERMKEYPQMKPLVLFLKYFLLQRGLHETYTGGMGSYLLCNVVLHFLQRHPARRNTQHYAATSLGHYLYDFFKYWGQEFRYDSQAVSVSDGGRILDRSERGKRKGKGKGKGKGLSLCLESPSAPSIDLGSAAYRMVVLRNLFQHAFNCICHSLVSRSPPEISMICPLLLDPTHPVITERHNLMFEQPVALPGLPRAREESFAEDVGPPRKKSRRVSSQATDENPVTVETVHTADEHACESEEDEAES